MNLLDKLKKNITKPSNCPPPPPKSNNNKGLAHFAFTLAETLITLTIIGVIAAMTIPTLLSKYQSHVQLTALKKAYSNLQNAMKMLPLSLNCGTDYNCVWDETGINLGDYNFYNQEFNKALAKQFKYTEIGEFTNINGLGLSCGYFNTPDGMTWGIHGIGFDYIDIWLDTTGTAKGPNKLGKDEFEFYIALDARNGIPAGTVMPVGSKLHSDFFGSDSDYWRNNDNDWRATGKVLELDKIDE